ncbi:hypothetical protein BOX15_Mlig008231g3 [Macrostomum lignano]|uniref:Uncharacterized protein n=2 Tax=Macrostomum lignano TaxID=282301 RepID=A0A267DPB9_9PLAT|nr:hypothetical protein BOX15_Mlig008231g3 [Macrostomum lignano]
MPPTVKLALALIALIHLIDYPALALNQPDFSPEEIASLNEAMEKRFADPESLFGSPLQWNSEDIEFRPASSTAGFKPLRGKRTRGRGRPDN